jgi:hypothetical protein
MIRQLADYANRKLLSSLNEIFCLKIVFNHDSAQNKKS